MTLQSPEKRVKNFSEVSLGFTKKQAVEEARLCPQPADPNYLHGCPLGIDLLSFIRSLRENDFTGALRKIRERNNLPSVCGRICSAPCEKENPADSEKINLGIRAFERAAGDYGQGRLSKQQKPRRKLEKIAVVGSGPSGLTAAGDLAKLGYPVTIFEALDVAGGSLRYRIPEFRLPKKVLDAEIDYIKSLGVEIKLNYFIGRSATIKEILDAGYGVVCLAVGAGVPKFSSIPGEHLNRVYLASEFLMRLNLSESNLSSKSVRPLNVGGTIAVIGFDETALDCARISLRLGKETILLCERSEEEMKASQAEVRQAKEEGCKMELFTKAIEILSDENHCAKGIKCIKMDFADPHASGKWQLVPVEGSDFIIKADTVVIATEYQPNSFLCDITEGLMANSDGSVGTHRDSFATSLKGVFATGEAVLGPSPAVDAMASAKKAVLEIDSYLKEKAASHS